MKYYEMFNAVKEAEQVLRNADDTAETIARILVGRLRRVKSATVLKLLKKELSNYNAHTDKWNN